MSNRITASAKTIGKYLFWTGVAAAASAAVQNLTEWNVPTLLIPVIASVLKGVATYAATEAAEK